MSTTLDENVCDPETLENEAERQFHLEKLQEIENNYVELKKEALEAKLKHTETLLNQLADGTLEELNQGLLAIENEILLKQKAVLNRRDFRVQSAKAWIDAERVSALNSVNEQKKFFRRKAIDTARARVYLLVERKQKMEEAPPPPPIATRPFKIMTRTPIWDRRNKTSTVPYNDDEINAAKRAAMEANDGMSSKRSSRSYEDRSKKRAKRITGPCVFYQLSSQDIAEDMERFVVPGAVKKPRNPTRRRR